LNKATVVEKSIYEKSEKIDEVKKIVLKKSSHIETVLGFTAKSFRFGKGKQAVIGEAAY